MHRLSIAITVTLVLGFTGLSRAQQTTATVPLFENLGTHEYTISTSVPLAQRYFNQGLRLYYGFNHAEAIRAFEEANRLDPGCAMCSWGIALACGPNINAPMDRAAGLAAYQALQRAKERQAKTNARERALIDALAARYAPDPPEDRAALDAAYANAMRNVVRQYPDDLEVATLTAEALMDLSPWNYWTRDGQPGPHTTELVGLLERVLAANPNHPGGNHFYIHALEAVQPERAVAAAERLAALMPGAGHIVHMPGHIYIRVGRYLDAIAANEHAVHADETYIRDRQPSPGMYTAGYYPHNYDFLAFAASLIGRSRQSIGAAEKMAGIAPAEMLPAPGMTSIQHHHTRHLQMKVRFSRWDDILRHPEIARDLPHARALWAYARGRALAATGKVADAEAMLGEVRSASTDPKLASQRLEFNTSGAILRIASEVLAGHVSAAKGDITTAVAHLREAARLEDALTYGEPPEWSVPVRQEIGVVLLKAGWAADAEQVFREDLKRFPDNGWSLSGLEQALRRQGKVAEADAVATTFKKVWSTADIRAPHATVTQP